MRKHIYWLAFLVAFALVSSYAYANVFGTVRGIVHDPQHRPVPNASVEIKSATSDWSQTAQTDDDGEFSFPAVPLGDYTVTITAKMSGFSTLQQNFTLASDTSPVLHLQLALAGVAESVLVTGSPVETITDSITPTTILDREDIQETPGADRTNGLEMITDYVPAAYVTHDMLHMRGGHQVDWLIDGVPIPNTNIASNLGPQIDPKDIDYIETLRGSYDADYGDRTYGIFNIVPRTGFERDNECDLLTTFGNYYQTNDQLSCGGHTQRFAYYASLNGNRSNYGLQAPIEQTFHDADNGFGGFASLIFNLDPQNQLRLVGSLRQDFYQIPIDPNPDSIGNQQLIAAGESPSYGLRDGEREPDGYLVFSWVHTFNPNTVLTVSPFYHYNSADYQPNPNDTPVISTVNQTANYGGLQAVFSTTFWKNDFQAGIYGFAQRQDNFFSNVYVACLPPLVPAQCVDTAPQSIGVTGGLAAQFFDDKFKVNSWLTLIVGLRQTEFSNPDAKPSVSENATDPRVGATVRIPKINWVFRGFYGYYYQAPPLSTATNALVAFAPTQGFAFLSLHGERDIEYQLGVTIPFRGWTLDADNYETRARNWLDHNNIGESNIFWPITWKAAVIQGWELTLRSPSLWHYGQFHLAYANQIAQATSPITGGLIFFVPPGFSPVDHDQRNTLNLGFNAKLPWQMYASTNVYYGSGFSNGIPDAQYPGNYLPEHTTFDLSVGKSFREKYTVSLTALNVANRRVELDNSLTFGGFHWNDPFQIYAEFRYRFHY